MGEGGGVRERGADACVLASAKCCRVVVPAGENNAPPTPAPPNLLRARLLYRRLLRSAALTAAAALPDIRQEAARLQLPPLQAEQQAQQRSHTHAHAHLRFRRAASAPPAATAADLAAAAAGPSAAAALPAAATASGVGVGVGGGCCFEVLGLDYLVDGRLRPWLLEVNATPSLGVAHADKQVGRWGAGGRGVGRRRGVG